MRSRWIGWSIVACAATTAAYAESHRRGGASSLLARVETDAAPRDLASAPAAPDAPAPEDLAPLTDDPELARGDRIEGNEVRGMVAFTFDDGPNPETTPLVVDALRRYDVPATFFVVTRRLVGPLAERNRELLGKLVAGGFVIASHTVSHTNLETLPRTAIRHEIDQSLRVLADQAGRAIGLFRAPFGALDDRGREHLRRRGLTEVKWSIDSMDYRERDGDKVRERALAAILQQEGGVVLMHDVREVTAKALALLLDDLEAANCRRLAGGKEPILPVSIHYWIRDRGRPREIPDEVRQRTLAYRAALPDRCAARAGSSRPERWEAVLHTASQPTDLASRSGP